MLSKPTTGYKGLTKVDVGQGGSMGMEDAEALGVVMAGATPAQLSERLKVWEKIRLNRSSGIQFFANIGSTKADTRHAGAAKYLSAERLPSKYYLSYHTYCSLTPSRIAGGLL